MNYLELVIRTSASGLEAVEAALMGIGVTEFTIDDPAEEQEMAWHVLPSEYVDENELFADRDREPSVTVYVESTPEGVVHASDICRVIHELRKNAEEGLYGEGFDPGTLEVTTELRSDEEWKDNWKTYFVPVRIGEHIVIQPSWQAYEQCDPDDILVSIDPGMAFGTGTHETTSITARLLERYLKKGDRMLDVGCGSGILSIIGVRLGASEALGIDIDEEAVKTSRENFILNGVERAASAEIGDLTEGIDFKADLVAANLLTNLVIRLTPSVPAHLVPGGIYLSSGILKEHEYRIRKALEENGFIVMEVLEDGDWCGFAARLG